MCDVYENDLSNVRVGEYADIRLNAYPNMVLRGCIGSINPVFASNLRAAKVHLEVSNPGMPRLSMFVTARFPGLTREVRAVVPATAVLHLHDCNWVYAPDGAALFRRIQVVGGNVLPGNMQATGRALIRSTGCRKTSWSYKAPWSSNDSRSR
jgi:cobalt-zinc-cadmium efflux system membrane fusion protein